ncbi:MAG: HNH endonuclease signature motif containing protein [Chloroflexi bacterium]|nr:HNH endonuclease signature motif containing protein [Chloroflexota bacterium]
MSYRRAYPLPLTWPILRRQVFDRDDWKCVQCGRRANLECDHKLAQHFGGTHEMENLQTLCRRCHKRKSRSERRQYEVSGQAEWDSLLGF